MTCLPVFFGYYVDRRTAAAIDIADFIMGANGDESTTFRTHAYRLTDQGWGAKYSNPATSPTGRTLGSKFRPQGDAVGWALTTVSPRAEAYAFSSLGYGSRYTNMSSIPNSSALSFSWSPGGDIVLVGTTNATGLYAYAWSSGWGSKFSDPANLEAGGRADISKDASYVFTSETASPYLAAYSFSGSGIGTKFADPAAAVEESSCPPVMNSDSSVVIVGQTATPYVKAYAFSGSGWGSAFSEPSSKYTNVAVASPNQMDFKSTDDYVAICHTGSSLQFNCAIYSWSSGWGTLLSDPATVTIRSYDGIKWVGNNYIVVVRDQTPHLFLYQWTGSEWGTRLSGPVTQPSVSQAGGRCDVRLY